MTLRTCRTYGTTCLSAGCAPCRSDLMIQSLSQKSLEIDLETLLREQVLPALRYAAVRLIATGADRGIDHFTTGQTRIL